MKTYCYFDTSNQRTAERSCPAVLTNHLYKHEFITCIYRCDAVLVYSFAFEKRLADGRMAFLNGHLAIEKSHAPIRPVARREGSSPLPFQPGPGGLRVGRGGSATTPENYGSGAPSLGGSRWREPPSLRSHEWLRRRPLPSRPVATAGLSRTPCAREDTGPHGSVALRGGPQQHNTVATARERLCHCSAPPGRPSHPWGSEGLCGAQGMGISPEPTALALSSLEAIPWLTAGGRGGKGEGGGSGEGGSLGGG